MTDTVTRIRPERVKARDWARQMIAADALVLDSETLGKEHDAGLCDLAIVSLSGVVVFDQLLNPGKPIPAEAQQVHGITDAMVADAPTFAEVFLDLCVVVTGRTIVTYNQQFDAGVINACCRAAGRIEIAQGWQCAMLAMADFRGERGRFGTFKWFRLSEAASHFGIENEGAHRALADAETCRQVVLAMAAAGGEKG